jgi:hypothetical protein
LLVAVLSCKGSGGCPSGGGGSGGGTGGGDGKGEAETTPKDPPDPVADGVDDTAGGEPTPSCLQDPVDGQSRARLQCAGSLEASLTLDVTVAGFSVDQDPVPIEKSFGNGQTDDTYADPLVMACCASVSAPFCASIASQTSCQSLPARIDEKAEEQGLAGPKEALHDLAAWIGNNQELCRSTFGSDEVATTSPACGAGDASAYDPLLAGRQWAIPATFTGGTTEISNVVITVSQASITGVHPVDVGAAEGCWSLADNDDAPHFLEIFPTGPVLKTN